MVCIHYVAGVSITKYGSAAQRTTCDMLRNLIIWTFLLNVPLGGKTEDFSWFQLGGFMVLACGVLVYNEIVVIPFWGFNKNTKIAIEERAKYQKEERTSIAFIKPNLLGEDKY
jgi:hypothetical protein